MDGLHTLCLRFAFALPSLLRRKQGATKAERNIQHPHLSIYLINLLFRTFTASYRILPLFTAFYIILGVRFILQAKFFNFCSKVQIAG